MGGGLMQLVAYGAQDIYLTGNPQITFFKVVYRRHTNFSMESIQQTLNGTAGFGNNVTATISRNGDLVGKMYLEHDASFDSKNTEQTGLCEHYGHSLIKECEIEIGGQKIDKHTSMWNRVYSDLTEFNPTGYFGATTMDTDVHATGNGTAYQLMTGNGYGLNTDGADAANDFAVGSTSPGTTVNGFTYLTNTSGSVKAKLTVNKIFIPINFWFCRNPGLSLPLIALQYHEVKIKMTFETMTNLIRTSDNSTFSNGKVGDSSNVTTTQNFDLWCDYIYLDTDERRRFAQVSHEYLIEQLQREETTISTDNPTIKLRFNHPVKELIWTTRNESVGTEDGRCQPYKDSNHGDLTASPVSLDEMGGNWKLKLNGHDRFAFRDTKYFTRTQVWQHHTGYGSLPTYGVDDVDLSGKDEATKMGTDSIAVYSFALKPEEHQPSGTCNFSRIDSAQLVGSSLTTNVLDDSPEMEPISTSATNPAVKVTIFAINYNVLRIMSGMGGLAYSN